MTDTTYGAKAAADPDTHFRVQDQGPAGKVPYHIEDTVQRAALIDALAELKPPAPGRAEADASSPVALSVQDAAVLGALNEAAPATDVAPAGLNARLQRIAQHFTSMLARLPANLGAKVSASSLSVTLASNEPLATAIGARGDAAAEDDAGAFSLIALIKRGLAHLAAIASATSDTAPALTSETPYVGAVLITPGTPVTPGRGVFIACTAPGSVRLLLSNDSTLDVPIAAGSSILDNFAVKDVVAANTSATVAVSVLVKA